MHEQREDVDIPVYHRQGLIRGTISHSRPEETSGIVQVYLKVSSYRCLCFRIDTKQQILAGYVSVILYSAGRRETR